MNNKLKFCLIGCGRISRKHADALANQIDDAELVAVADVKPERAEALANEFNCMAYTDYNQMLSEKPCDVVCILSESGLHAKHSVDVARHFKKHIVVEKPMALTLNDADAMIRACDESGVRLFVVKQNRYNIPVVKLREALEAGRFGKLVMGTVRVRWMRDQSYYDQDSWRGTWAMDGGVFANQASHHIDLLEWMMGDVDSVYAKGATQLVDIETEDTGAAILKFRNGALGIVEATTAARPKDLEGSISILGEGGAVEIGGFAINEIKTWNFAQPQAEDAQVIETHRVNPPNCYGFGHIEYLRNVIISIQNRSAALVDGLEGRRSLELVTAIYESIETGREIPMRFHPHQCKLGQDYR